MTTEDIATLDPDDATTTICVELPAAADGAIATCATSHLNDATIN